MRRFHYDEIDSTSSEAQRLTYSFADEPFVVSATTQAQGRGRGGNVWRSPPGGLWFSVGWPCTEEASRMDATPLVVGLAVADAIECVIGPCDALQLKWPNDVLLDHQKVAGILCERTLTPMDAERLRWFLVVGVGINVNVPPESLAAGLRYPATSLLIRFGKAYDLQTLLDICLVRMAERLDRLGRNGFTEDDRLQVENRLAWQGEGISVLCGSRTWYGTLKGLDDFGRLLLDIHGQLCRFEAGEIQSVRPSAMGNA